MKESGVSWEIQAPDPKSDLNSGPSAVLVAMPNGKDLIQLMW